MKVLKYGLSQPNKVSPILNYWIKYCKLNKTDLPYYTKRGLNKGMKYVYAILTIVDNNPIMQTYVSDTSMSGRQILDKVVLTKEEKRKYSSWEDENEILKDMNKRQSIRVEIQEVGV